MNALEKLLNEIERVTVIRTHYEELRGAPNVIVEPQIMMMTASINAGKYAAASGDAITVIRAIKDLEEYSE